MRVADHNESRSAKVEVVITPMFIMTVLVFVFCMAILMVFRQHCIDEGHKIAKLSSELDEKVLRYEAISKEYSDALRREKLFNMGESMGFTFPVGGKVFYVK